MSFEYQKRKNIPESTFSQMRHSKLLSQYFRLRNAVIEAIYREWIRPVEFGNAYDARRRIVSMFEELAFIRERKVLITCHETNNLPELEGSGGVAVRVFMKDGGTIRYRFFDVIFDGQKFIFPQDRVYLEGVPNEEHVNESYS